MPNPVTVVDLDGLRYYNTKLDAKFNNKVDKVDGKGLSTNDYTNSEQAKLSNIEANAQVNIIEAINVNGNPATITSKGVNITVPTNNNQLTNGAGYQTASDVESSISSAIADKVDKETGKGLSSNDYTSTEKTKLEGIDNGAQVNIIEEIKVNGTAQTVTSKGIDITVPTNNNQLTNGAGYQTASDVNALISTAIANASHITKQVVNELPVTGVDNVIYMVPNGTSSGNARDEYMWINNAWERVGSSDIDLSDYLQVSDLTSITNAQIDAILNGSTSGS